MRRRVLVVAILAMMLVASLAPGITRAQSGELEIFSWWAGDEGPALEALIALYNQQYPDVTVNNATVTGGSGVNARAVLKTRMLGGDPPDTFQVHAGQELIGTWVVAGRMEDLTQLYTDEGWFDAFPQGLIDQQSYEGGIYSVAVNIHRSNVMWYNPAKLSEWGVEPPTSFDEFFAACDTLKGAGVTPLVVGEAWTVNHLWESVALGVLGPENWNALWTGGLDPAGAEMVAVWDTFGKVLECTNIDEDASGLSWQQATDKVVGGEAAFNVMGDWAAGYMATTLGLTPGDDFGWAPPPGTDGAFLWLSDGFGLPAGSPNPDATLAWLKLLGSADGQNAFNPLKGSIPARLDALDAAPDLYNDYLKSSAADWAVDTLSPSFVHGAAANERFSGDFGQVMEIYLASRSADAAANAMAAVCLQSAACGGGS